MSDLFGIILYLGLLIALPIVAFAAIWIVLRRIPLFKPNQRMKLFRGVMLFAIIGLGIDVINTFIDPPGYAGQWSSGLVLSPLEFFRQAIPVLLGVWIYFILRPVLDLGTSGTQSFLGEDELGVFISKILDSKSFLTVFRSALPTGAADKELGLDFFPFILQRIEDRRHRFARSARVFLGATIALGLVFAGVITCFGYILINEAAAGPPRVLADVREETREISRSLDVLLPAYYQSDAFRDAVERPLERLEATAPGRRNAQLAQQVDSAIAATRFNRDYSSLVSFLNAMTRTVSKQDQEESVYAQSMTDAAESLVQFREDQQAALPRLGSSITSLNQEIPRIQAALEAPDNRVAELIKRIALGVVVVTFLLAILRYLAGIYVSHHQEMLRAEAEDLSVRRFYIALKSSSASEEQRKAVLSAFISGMPATSSFQGTDGSVASKAEMDVLKEFLSALAKKI